MLIKSRDSSLGLISCKLFPGSALGNVLHCSILLDRMAPRVDINGDIYPRMYGVQYEYTTCTVVHEVLYCTLLIVWEVVGPNDFGVCLLLKPFSEIFIARVYIFD